MSRPGKIAGYHKKIGKALPSALLKIRKAINSGGVEVEGGDGLVIRKGTPHKLILQRKNVGFIAFLEVLLH